MKNSREDKSLDGTLNNLCDFKAESTLVGQTPHISSYTFIWRHVLIHSDHEHITARKQKNRRTRKKKKKKRENNIEEVENMVDEEDE